MAMCLAVAALLRYIAESAPPADADLGVVATASRAIYESVLEASATGVRTPDLGGHSTTSDFIAEVIARVRTKIEIWSSLNPQA